MTPGVVLVGFMGSGKSTVGRLLADMLGVGFVELDSEIERTVGMSVGEIFSANGEEAFRRMEREAIDVATAIPGRVIATGGGAFVDPANMERLRDYGVCVHLAVSPETVLVRLKGDVTRPLLSVDGKEARVRDLLLARSSAYEQADLSVSTDGRTPESVAGELLLRLSKMRREG